MNENSPSDTAADEHTKPRSDGFFNWLRGLSIVRSSDDRWFAGVAAGIAARAGIDPLIVRGVFVVLTILGGPGLLLYLAGWLFLPDRHGRIQAEEIVRGRAQTGIIVTAAILVGLILIPLIFGLSLSVWGWAPWGFAPEWLRITMSVLFWALVVPGLIVWLIVWLSSDRSHAGRSGSGPASGAAPSSASEKTDASGRDTAHSGADWASDLGRSAAQWGEDAGRKAEEWGERYSEAHEARRFGAGATILTLALALLTGGAALMWGMGAEIESPYTSALIAAVAVLGVAAIVAGIRGRDTGWVGFISFIGVIVLLFVSFTAVKPGQTQIVPFGHVTVGAADTGDNQALLIVGGDATVDLSNLHESSSPRVIEVWQLGGNVTVELPTSHPARAEIHLAAGNVRDIRSGIEDRQGGIFMGRSLEGPAAGSAGSDATVVRVNLFAGNVYVEEQAAHRSSESERLERMISEQEAQLRELRAELEDAR